MLFVRAPAGEPAKAGHSFGLAQLLYLIIYRVCGVVLVDIERDLLLGLELGRKEELIPSHGCDEQQTAYNA